MKPFTIQLLYDTPEKVPTLYGATDPGRTNIGNAVVNEDGECFYMDKVETRNKDVTKNMTDRKNHRRARRRGERLVRKRRAKKNNTLSTKLKDGRLIPGTKKPTNVKDIINTEARFQNRKKRQLITPSVKHLVETHLNHIDNICKILPIKGWCLEANKFAFMKMEDNSVYGIDFQNGRLKGYESAEEFVYERQNGKCFCCGEKIEHYHHIVPRSQGGSDGPENIIGICENCHSKHHKGELEIDVEGYNKKYAPLSVLNQAVPYIYKGLVERFGEENVFICSGYDTKMIRESASYEKDHNIDALCISYSATGVTPKKTDICYSVKQFRRHDRAKIKSQTERTYKLNGKTVAKNRKPRFEQKGLALSQWKQDVSKLTVKKSTRRYNDTKRLMPGALVRHKNKIFVKVGQITGGQYFRHNGKNIPSKDCEILQHNVGLVYM